MPVNLPTLPEDNATMCIVYPNSPEWRQLYIGAILQLTRWWYYNVENESQAEDVTQRVSECIYLTTQDLYGCIDTMDCQDIQNCIETTPSLQDLISSISNSTSYSQSIANSQSQNADNLAIGTNPTCDEDILFGQCLQLVEYLHGINLDILELIEVGTNVSEIAFGIFGNVAEGQAQVISAILDWLLFVQQSIAENYNAQITQNYLEQRACDIFCEAIAEGCSITPTILFDTWSNRLNSGLSIDALFDITFDFLVTGTWSGEQIADFMFFAQIATRSQLGQIVGQIAYNDIRFRLGVYANDPNPDWQLLCDCSEPTWEQFLDFTSDSYSAFVSIVDNFGVYVSGQGYRSVNTPSDNRELIYLDIDFTSSVSVNFVRYHVTNTQPNWGNGNLGGSNLYAGYNRNPQIQLGLIDVALQVPQATYTLYDGVDVQSDVYTIRNNPRNGSVRWYLNGITMRGTGNNPFV